MRFPRSRRRSPVPLGDFARLSRRGPWYVGLAMMLVAALLVTADRQGWWPGQETGDWGKYHGKRFEVVHVVDGDTLDVSVADGDKPKTRIRLIGVNTPEIAHGGQKDQPFGQAAKQLTMELADGKTVRLELQRQEHRDRYGRLLAYVQLPDQTWLNERLIAAGLARAERRFKHELLERYALIEDQARKDRIGIWQTAQTGKKSTTTQPVPAPR